MPEVTEIELATYLDVTPSTVADLAAKGRVVRLSRGKYDLQASIRTYCAYQRELIAGRTSASEGLAEQKARLAKAQADLREFELNERAGKYLAADVVERAWIDIIVIFRRKMMALPGDIAGRLPHLTRQDTILIDDAVRDALNAAADEAEQREDAIAADTLRQSEEAAS